MKEILIVTKETYLRQVKSWSFFLMIISPFIFIGFSLGIGYISGSSAAKTDKIAIIAEDPSVKEAFKTIPDTSFAYKNAEAAKKALEKEKISGFLAISEKDGSIIANYHSKEEMSDRQKGQFQQVLLPLQNQLNLKKAQLSPSQIKDLAKKPQLISQKENKFNYNKISKYISFFGLTFIMYFIIMIYASQTVQEIASEKGTKIMEVIFSSIPAEKYFYGRILGILSVILTHVGIYILGAYLIFQVANQIENSRKMLEGIKPILSSTLKHLDWSMIFFAIFGVLIYVVLAALCGSLVTRAEQAGQAAQPPIYLIIVAFFGALTFGQGGTDALVLKIGSYLPFISTFFMPIRLINGYASQAESILSLGVLVLSTLALTIYIGKAYSGLILQTDDIGFYKSLKKGLSHK
ncbi:ABC transporter permease [Streptococcus catagoni]|uniref:ABC transporter permease n=1 Tax=Streptococcus catagoni TaxID=2654874 RepID=UPI001409910A|nr:ABC transporter permease [Streptococcus catagoni]